MNILKNRYGDGNLIQRYEVDYGINKYKPIQEINPQTLMRRPTRSADSLFKSGRSF